MKKILYLFLLISSVSYGQVWSFQGNNYNVAGSFYAGTAGTNGRDTSNAVMVVQKLGNVGIGTTIPAAKLDVLGDALIKIDEPTNIDKVIRNEYNRGGLDTLNYSEMGKNGFIVNTSCTSCATSSIFAVSQSGNVVMQFIDANSKVGIGTASPVEKLDVNGSFKSVVVNGTVTTTISNTDNSNPTAILKYENSSNGTVSYLSADGSCGTMYSENGAINNILTVQSNLTNATTTFGNSTGAQIIFVDTTFYTSNVNVGIDISTPTEKLDVVGNIKASGGYFGNISDLKVAPYTIQLSDYTILSDAQDVTLPTAVGIAGRIFIIKNADGANMDVLPNGSETIDGAASFNLTSNASVMVQSDGTNWYVISHYH